MSASAVQRGTNGVGRGAPVGSRALHGSATDQEEPPSQRLGDPNREPGDTSGSPASLRDDFIEAFGEVWFSNSSDINEYFQNQTGLDFCTWFSRYIGSRGAWRGRSIRVGVLDTARNNFVRVWDNISLMFSGTHELHQINLLQFFTLVSIMINETGGTFVPLNERGDIRILFNRYNRRDNLTAYELFRNDTFLEAHRDKALSARVAHTRNEVWNGQTYPTGFPTSPDRAGIIAEADFFKFRGRGLIQGTFRPVYRWYVNELMAFSPRNQAMQQHKNRWEEVFNAEGADVLLHKTSNSDWDILFEQTNLEFPCFAIYVFQKHKDDFLTIPMHRSALRPTRTPGTITYAGYRVGGRVSSGPRVHDRCFQMMRRLLQDYRMRARQRERADTQSQR